ncbi:hypothetical protein [Cohnella sp. AR92]|uniref:hypothetical protein n=1 Tax=Cohnella sp. AR92 TaxID=648716 RepID=UPI000F8CCAF2|nr:hypothetical protein [Cohnella sp. AR92]RUS45705.1 hypothetical protein ELR57_17720 [Cohnella sp. AR92]
MAKRAAQQRIPTATILQSVAKAMLPFYNEIARNGTYAASWSKAVIDADLDRMQKLLRQVSPSIGDSLGSNAIGYFISFSFADPDVSYTNGTTIPPGSVQFFFETRVHRAIARSVLPFYRKIATSRAFALALAKAIRQREVLSVRRLTRSLVRTAALRSVTIEDSGIALSFKHSFSRYSYRNLLLLEGE